ncbi:MAG: two-CW domain-containing protein [Planctomycetota bacterium]|jgi:hypothetical protein
MPRKKRYWTDHPHDVVRELERVRETLRYSMREMAEALDVPFRTYQKWVYSHQKPRRASALRARGRTLLSPPRMNCWDYLACGREPGGENCHLEGACPAAVDGEADGINSGTNGGRVCWAISGTFCGTRAQGTEASKILSCFGCGFFTRVIQEEGLANFMLLKPGQVYAQP